VTRVMVGRIELVTPEIVQAMAFRYASMSKTFYVC
jgi:hypothetical protein